MTSFARSIFDRLVRVETMLWNRCDDELERKGGLRLGRLEVLRVLADIENCRVNDIATRMKITVGAVSKVVDKLEASGHCQRHPNPDDRRSSVLTVTDLGRSALAEAEEILDPILQKYLPLIDLDAFNNALLRLEQEMEETE